MDRSIMGVNTMSMKNNQKTCIIDIETNGDCWTGRIISISLMNAESKEISAFSGEEDVLLSSFLENFKKNGYNHIVGFNLHWDIQYIFSKCMKYQLAANGFFRARTTDLMMVLKGINGTYNFNRPGRLAEWTQLIGNHAPTKTAPIPVLFEQKKVDEIVTYNKQHVQAIYDLWQRIDLVMER